MKAIAQLLVLIILLLGYLFFTQNSYAQQGCCSWHGGVSHCDYSTGRKVCMDGTYSPSCTCGSTYYEPEPDCPLMSRYNSLTEQCECYSGYVASGGQCVSVYTYCSNLLGFHSTYSYLNDMCECSYGYQLNLSGTKCISNDEACQEQFGYNSKATILGDKCECKYGYVWEGNKCVYDTSDYNNGDTYYFIPQTQTTIETTPTPTQIATVVPTPKSTSLPTPIQTKSSTPTPHVLSATSTPTPFTTFVPTPKPIQTNNNTTNNTQNDGMAAVAGLGTLGLVGFGLYKYANRKPKDTDGKK